MLELVAATAIIYFVHRSWSVYKTGYEKARSIASRPKNEEALTREEVAQLKRVLKQK